MEFASAAIIRNWGYKMSKAIKVDEQVYARLEELRDWKETFSQVIVRLLKVYDVLYTVRDVLGPGHFLRERPVTDVRAKEKVHKRGDRPALPY